MPLVRDADAPDLRLPQLPPLPNQMSRLLVLLSILLVGCGPAGKPPNKEQERYRIIWMPPHGSGQVWTTPYAPWANTYGFMFRLADGRHVQVSGNVIIEEQYR